MKRLLSGIKPTGDLTLGNYIGAIKQFIELQNEYETFIFIADLHALTVYNEPKELRERIKKIAGIYLASGLDYHKNTIFVQSENPYHAQLGWILECNVYMGELGRMTQFKDKALKEKKDALSCGLFTYPALMAADILIYDADIVPVGIDQKQHLELARDIATRFNNKYGVTFKIPEVKLTKTGLKIMDLQNPLKKMDKSDDNDKGCIFLLESINSVRKKIMSAVTDSEAIVKYDEKNKPGISNLMNIYSSLTEKTIKDIEKEFENQNYGYFKTKVADTVVELLEKIQTKYNQIVNSNLIEEILDAGKEKSILISEKKFIEVKNKIGLGR